MYDIHDVGSKLRDEGIEHDFVYHHSSRYPNTIVVDIGYGLWSYTTMQKVMKLFDAVDIDVDLDTGGGCPTCGNTADITAYIKLK